MVADSAVFISHKQSGTIPDGRETTSAMIADGLRYMKTRLTDENYKFRPCHEQNTACAVISTHE